MLVPVALLVVPGGQSDYNVLSWACEEEAEEEEGFYAIWGDLCTKQLKPTVIPDLVERSALE
jgi:hypothetical protein